MALATFFGSLGGAALGGIGSGIQAAGARRTQTRFRRRQRKAIQSARNFAGGTTVTTGQGFFGDKGTQVGGDMVFAPGAEIPKGVSTFVNPVTGERQAGGRVDELLASPLLSQARSFLEGTFGNAADSPLAQDFVKGIRAAQSARGTFFGGSAETQEAGGLSAFSQRLRQDLLPQALAFGTLPETLRQSVLGFEAPLRTAAATGGSGLGDSSGLNAGNPLAAIFSGALSGAAGGFNLAREFSSTSVIDQLLGGSQGPQLTPDQLDRISRGFQF
jgi:hypothetical protein